MRKEGKMPLSPYRLKMMGAGSISVLFLAGIVMAIVGGVSGNPVVFGVGLGMAAVATVAGIGIREHNIAGN